MENARFKTGPQPEHSGDKYIYGLILFPLFTFLVIFNLALYQKHNSLQDTALEAEANESGAMQILSKHEAKEIGSTHYQMILKKQKDLNSTYFNQQVSQTMEDKVISNSEYTHLNTVYKQIIQNRKSTLPEINMESEVFTEEDRLNSIKKEINMHSLSQNDNLI